MKTADKIGQVIVYIARHGEVDLDREKKIRGLQNVKLNEKGTQEAQELVEFFSPIPLSAVYTDDLKRTYHTALPIAHDKRLKVNVDPDLRSWDVGSDLEGKSIDANEDKIKELKQQPDKIPAGGQSWGDFEKQTIAAFYRYVDEALSSPCPILLVIHGSGIQVIWKLLGALSDTGHYDVTPLKPAGVGSVSLHRKGLSVKILKGAKDIDE